MTPCREPATIDGRLLVIAGDSYSGNQVAIVDSYTADNWYFYGVTMSYDSGADETTINTYAADITGGDTTFTSTHNATVSGTFRTSLPHGIGLVNNNGTVETPFWGTIDEITFYSGVKDEQFFQSNLDRILFIPEPSSMFLLGLAAVTGMAIRRRRRNGEKQESRTLN